MNHYGYTLMEVVVSVLLLALALAPLVQLYPPLLSAGQSQQQTELLSFAASGKLEELAQELRSERTVQPGFTQCPAVPGCLVVWNVQDVIQNSAGSLRHPQVTACVDGNANSRCDPQEEQVRYETRVTSRP